LTEVYQVAMTYFQDAKVKCYQYS